MHSERLLNATTLCTTLVYESKCLLSSSSGLQVGVTGCPGKGNIKLHLSELIVGTSCRGYQSQDLRFLGCDLGADDDNLIPGDEKIKIQS